MDGQIQLTKRNVVGNIGMLWFDYPDGSRVYERTMTEEEYLSIGNKRIEQQKAGATGFWAELSFMVDTPSGFLGEYEYTIHQDHVYLQLAKKTSIPHQIADGFRSRLPLDTIDENGILKE